MGSRDNRKTVGLLSRRGLELGSLHFIVKESNELEARESGELEEVQMEYVDNDKRRRIKAAAMVEAKGMSGAAWELGMNERTMRRRMRDLVCEVSRLLR